MNAGPSILVAVASYGTAQDHFLAQVVAEYKRLGMQCRIVVLSNIDKPVEGAEVLVGLPSRDPYSLPFAHRKLFADNVDDYDLFVYTEDDTLLTGRNIEAFLQVQRELQDDEIAGFVRSETSPEGQRYIVSVNHFFRWLPDSVVQRGELKFARFSNEHSGCYLVTRPQLKRAIASGGFLVEPRARMYGILETAASDIYTQCGLRRLICLSRIEDFIVPHLANKYYGQMGIPVEEFDAQVRALSSLDKGGGWVGSLFNPQTRAPDFRWSRNLYDAADEAMLRAIPATARRVLSMGATLGSNEMSLARRGHSVCAIPLDPVFGDSLRRKGIPTTVGPIDEAMERLEDQSFDAILMDDVLHRFETPAAMLKRLVRTLAPGGFIVGTVARVPDLLSILRDWKKARRMFFSPNFAEHGLHPVGKRRLISWFEEAGLMLLGVTPEVGKTSSAVAQRLLSLPATVGASRMIFRAARRTSGIA